MSEYSPILHVAKATHYPLIKFWLAKHPHVLIVLLESRVKVVAQVLQLPVISSQDVQLFGHV